MFLNHDSVWLKHSIYGSNNWLLLLKKILNSPNWRVHKCIWYESKLLLHLCSIKRNMIRCTIWRITHWILKPLKPFTHVKRHLPPVNCLNSWQYCNIKWKLWIQNYMPQRSFWILFKAKVKKINFCAKKLLIY